MSQTSRTIHSSVTPFPQQAYRLYLQIRNTLRHLGTINTDLCQGIRLLQFLPAHQAPQAIIAWTQQRGSHLQRPPTSSPLCLFHLQVALPLQECFARMSHKNAIQECPTRVSSRVFRKSVPRECPARVLDKSVGQECPTRLLQKIVRQEFPTRVSHKSVIQECPAGVSCKDVPQECVLQELSTRVSLKSVI